MKSQMKIHFSPNFYVITDKKLFLLEEKWLLQSARKLIHQIMTKTEHRKEAREKTMRLHEASNI